MTAVLEIVYSLPFGVGLLAGIVGQRAWCHLSARWQDNHHPLPGGRKRRVGGISQQALGALLTLAVVGYILIQTEQTSQRITTCQTTFQEAIAARAVITTQNDALSVKQRDLLTELDDASGVWVNRLINPPPDIAAMDINDPRRQSWSIDVTRVYYERASKLRGEIASIRAEQTKLTEERNAHPLTDPSC